MSGPAAAPYQLGPLEVVTGFVGGPAPGVAPLSPGANAGLTPRQALEAEVARALARPPCAVTFSGGRDSSAVLALATAVARRDGYSLPIPVTSRYEGAPESDETGWQEAVVSHLGLPDWEIVHHTDDLDLIGPIARPVLQRWGPLFPTTAYSIVPFTGTAAGGSLLTGLGGDQVLASGDILRASRLLSFQQRPRLGDWRIIGAFFAPQALRTALDTRRLAGFSVPWLTEMGNEALRQALRASWAPYPRRLGPMLLGPMWQDKHQQATVATMEALCADGDVRPFHPLQCAGFLSALAQHGPRAGYASRDHAMADLFGDVLPPAVVTRHTKALFNTAFFSQYSREFAADWDGSGLDTSLVDPEALKEQWQAAAPDGRTFAALQAAWLANMPKAG